ncbi:YkgJ family cysteine cluster protein [Aestuariirhabdus sp. Z084]|uniref:YkgJ family cysteine cluster protein n=1 Tax=Aestuariirhabdus haliotis TaxID=2918751 RepID=UPI00201B3657|nr:YkgJ family cysteine cluster protein [Aestuariirhabdus haliotis]MCL6414504.1 YkgJ family cysteine cluster protein [Aestuariirhabdus haliotis]MCL6418514.1 YkgJ family cysteine cluster protein [Aestuariirhabdus haliotis]
MRCRSECGACCVAPSIAGALPGMPNGKPAGVRCIHLDDLSRCKLFGMPERPSLCAQFQAEESVCGHSQQEALERIRVLEELTR